MSRYNNYCYEPMTSSYITTLPFRHVFRECIIFDLHRRNMFAAITLKFQENKEKNIKKKRA